MFTAIQAINEATRLDGKYFEDTHIDKCFEKLCCDIAARNPNPGFEIAATLTELIQKGRTLAERNQYQYEPPPDESMPDKSDKEDILHTPYKTKKK